MPDPRDERPRRNVGRLIAAWAALTTLLALTVASALIYGTLWFKERRRVRQFAEDLVSRDFKKRDRAETLLLELGSEAEALLEKAARHAPGSIRGECQAIL